MIPAIPTASVIRAKPPPAVAHIELSTSQSSADCHVDDGQLVFALLDDNTGVLLVRCHPVKNGGGRSHRISRVELASCGISPQTDGFVAGDERTTLLGELPLACDVLGVLLWRTHNPL